MARVTVVTPVGFWNDCVKRAVSSALAQGECVGEILLVDNAISGYRENIERFNFSSVDPRIRVVNSDRIRSPARARNIGLSQARFEYCAVLDSDDEYLPGHLNNAISELEANSAVMYFCAYMNRDPGRPDQRIVPRGKFNSRGLIEGCCLGHSTNVFRSDLGVRYPEIGRRHDYGMWLTQARFIPEERIVFSASVGVIRHKTINSLSSVSNARLFAKQVYVTFRYAGISPLSAALSLVKFVFNWLRKINENSNFRG